MYIEGIALLKKWPKSKILDFQILPPMIDGIIYIILNIYYII